MASAEQLSELFGQVARGYKHLMESELAEAGTTPARARLLSILMCSSPRKMYDLSRELAVTPRNVTKLVDALEAEQLVERQPHSEDRRVTLIRLTPAGVDAAKESFLKSHTVHQVFDALSERDRQDLARVLGRLLTQLHHRVGAKSSEGAP